MYPCLAHFETASVDQTDAGYVTCSRPKNSPVGEAEFLFRLVREGGTAGAVILVVYLFIQALSKVVETFGGQIAKQQEHADAMQRDAVVVLKSLDSSVQTMNATMVAVSARLDDHGKLVRDLKEDHDALLEGRGCRASDALANVLRNCPFAAECIGKDRDAT